MDSHTGELFHFIEESVETSDGKFYLNEENANYDGYHCMENTGRWLHESWDRVCMDDYSGDYFEKDNDTIILSGNYYMDIENAESDGWIFIPRYLAYVREEDLVYED